MERERANSNHGHGVSDLSESHHGPFRSKKKEKGYKSVGLRSSDEDEDIAILPNSEQSSGKAAKSRPFRLKKRKSFKERNIAAEEALERSKFKHTSNTNPFDDRPPHASQQPSCSSFVSGKIQVNTTNTRASFSVSELNDTQIFGISLARAIQIDHSPDGLQVPAFFHVCINYIEDHGLDVVGIYRISGAQSKIQELKQHFNRGDRVRLNDYDVSTVADIIKLFIRELPEKLISDELTIELDECAELPDLGRRVDAAVKVLNKMRNPERTLLGLVMIHMMHVIEHQEVNKMNLKNVAVVLEPTLSIRSSKALNFLLTHTNDLFAGIKLSRVTGSVSNTEQSLSLLREDLLVKEACLNRLHEEIKQGKASKKKEEKIWDIQRQVTELKRKIRTLEKITNVMIGSDGNQRRGSKAVSSPASLKPTVAEELLVVATDENSRDLKVMQLELIDSICLYQLLWSNNQNLRDKIVKENAQLNAVCEQLNTGGVADEPGIPKSAMVELLQQLIEQYHSSKKLTEELQDAILSETSELVRISAEINSRKMRSQLFKTSSRGDH